MLGERHGRLLVVAREGTASDRKALWRCRCICGRECIVRSTALRSGHTQSCGCLQAEMASVSSAIARGWRHARPTP